MRIVTTFKDVDLEVWARFVDAHPEGNIFQTPDMFRVFQTGKKYTPGIVACFEQEKMLGVLVWVIQKEYSNPLGALTSRAIVFGGPLVLDKNVSVVEGLLEKHIAQIKKKAIYTEFRNLFDLDWAWKKFEKQGFSSEAHVNFLIDLKQSEAELLASMSQSRRKMLRRVIKNDELEVHQVKSIDDLREFYRLVEITYKRVGKPYPSLNHFLESRNILGENAACFLCFKGSTPVASRFVFGNGNGLYDWYAGSDPSYNSFNPNEYIVWEILLWGRSKGYEVFDFGGGGNPNKPYGPREFKRRFGGNEVRYNRFTKVHKPFLLKFGKFGFKVKQRLGL